MKKNNNVNWAEIIALAVVAAIGAVIGTILAN